MMTIILIETYVRYDGSDAFKIKDLTPLIM